MTSAIEGLKRRFQRFADVECGEYSKLYCILAQSVAADDELIHFIAQTPDQQPNLFFASVQYLSGPDGMPASAFELKAFINKHGNEVAKQMRSRHTQTNEIGRCAVILPALPNGPLVLVEVGASAGLCLMFDKFLYDYGTIRTGISSSPVLLRCAVTGPAPIPPDVPTITWRSGLDIDPIDLNDDDGVRWLLACIWSDHGERRRRVKAAIEMCRKAPPVVCPGDLVDDLPALMASAPKEGTLVVFHSAVFPYVSPDRRRAFVNVLADFSKQREIVWISNEGPGAIPEMDALTPPRNRLRFQLGRVTLFGGNRKNELLALGDPHGWDLEWLH